MGNLVISIGRQTGSRGRIIGREIAKRLGISFYDKEILSVAAKHSGMSKHIFEYHDEKPTNSFLYSLVMDTYSNRYPFSYFGDLPINQKVFLAQFDAIKKLAEQESCVIIGRCADYALRDHKELVTVFVHGDLDYRAHNIADESEDLDFEKARDMIIKTDKKRANYYNYYTEKKWGDSSGYDLCIDSQALGIEGTITLILKFIEMKQKRLEENS